MNLPKEFNKSEFDFSECMDTNFIRYFCSKFVTENNVDTKDFDSNLDAYDPISLAKYVSISSSKYMQAIDSYKQYGNISREYYANIHSNMEENFNDYRKKLTSDGSPKESEVLNLYHACSYAATAGILGKTGGWFMGNEFTKTAKSLGNGAYFGFKDGK